MPVRLRSILISTTRQPNDTSNTNDLFSSDLVSVPCYWMFEGLVSDQYILLILLDVI